MDAVLVLQISALLAGSVECGREADANLDGTTTAVDAALILQHSAALLRLPDPIGCRSTLDYPEPNAVLDNGRTDGRDNTIWHFEWSDCENRDRYHLYVRHPASGLVIVDKDNIRQSLHHSVYYGVIPEDQRSGWQWRVRAMMKGVWSEWSSWQPFDVEKANLDPAVE
jgi:hypothetical protein